jgi:hypothetical protein
MSVDFWTKPHLRMKELFDGRLKKWGIFEPRMKGKFVRDMRYIADGQDYVVVYSGNKGLVSIIASYALGNPYKILKAISEAFEVDIWLELDLQGGHHKRVIKRPTTTRRAGGIKPAGRSGDKQ